MGADSPRPESPGLCPELPRRGRGCEGRKQCHSAGLRDQPGGLRGALGWREGGTVPPQPPSRPGFQPVSAGTMLADQVSGWSRAVKDNLGRQWSPRPDEGPQEAGPTPAGLPEACPRSLCPQTAFGPRRAKGLYPCRFAGSHLCCALPKTKF